MVRIYASVRENDQDYDVEILNVFTAGDGRQIASVEALPVNGRRVSPFDNYSDRGPSTSSTTRIPTAFLKNIRFGTDRTPAQIHQDGGYIWQRPA